MLRVITLDLLIQIKRHKLISVFWLFIVTDAFYWWNYFLFHNMALSSFPYEINIMLLLQGHVRQTLEALCKL